MTAAAASVNLKWNANPEDDISGYRVRYGTSPGDHPQSVDTGSAIRVTVPGLVEGTTYYFVVTAISTSGQESEESDEISYQVPGPPPAGESSPRGGFKIGGHHGGFSGGRRSLRH